MFLGDGFGFQTNFFRVVSSDYGKPRYWRNDLQTDLQDVSFKILPIY